MDKETKTPEREMYEDSLRQMQERISDVHDAATLLVAKAAELGVELTMEKILVKGSLPAMGSFDTLVEVRPSRTVYQFLDVLEQAAIKSEQDEHHI